MNTTTRAKIAINTIAFATIERIVVDLRKLIYTGDRLQEKLELHKLVIINNEQRKAEDKLNELRLAFSELERKRILEVNAVNANAEAARLALDEAVAKQVDKLDIVNAVLFEAHDQYVEKADSRGWAA